MALPFLAQAGIMAAPSVVGGLARLLARKPKVSPYERRLSNLASMYEAEARKPLNQTAVFKAGMAEMDTAEDKVRSSANRGLTRVGATDESKLATNQSINDSRQKGLLGLLQRSDFSRQQSVNNSVALDRARQEQANSRIAQRDAGIGAVTSGLSGAASAIIGMDQENDYMNFLKGKGTRGSKLNPGRFSGAKFEVPKLTYR